MERILDVAQYLYDKYKKLTGSTVSEAKLHSLLYFAQRESFALTGAPLFEDELYGWKFGPVSLEVRLQYYEGEGILAETDDVSDEAAYLLNNVILQYGALAAWKLRDLSRNEQSWKNARKDCGPSENGGQVLALEDIKADAKKVRPYDHAWDMYFDEFEDFVEEGVN